MRYSTIKAYLTALKFYNTIYGFNSEGCFSDQLHYILRGIRRTQAVSLPPRPRRIPITTAHLRLLFQFVTDAFSPTDALCYRAAFSLAFFGLLRVSEFTCPTSHTFDPRVHLSLRDIRFTTSPPMVHVYIKQSKTDPFRQGCVVRVARTGNILCPFDALQAFCRSRPRGTGPLFTFRDGSFLTRADIHTVLSHTFPFIQPASMGTHSFRIGGASMLCSLGVPDSTVQILGRWSSDAFRRYLRVSDQYLSDLHSRAARQGSSFSRIWHADFGHSQASHKRSDME